MSFRILQRARECEQHLLLIPQKGAYFLPVSFLSYFRIMGKKSASLLYSNSFSKKRENNCFCFIIKYILCFFIFQQLRKFRGRKYEIFVQNQKSLKFSILNRTNEEEAHSDFDPIQVQFLKKCEIFSKKSMLKQCFLSRLQSRRYMNY